MAEPGEKLKNIYFRVGKNHRIVFHYQFGKWERYEVLHPWDIGDAFKVTLKLIEAASPGTLAAAAAADDRNFQKSKSRTRRYIAESPDLLYIDSPHLTAQSVEVSGFYVLTNIPWRDVPSILKLACDAARLGCNPLSKLTL